MKRPKLGATGDFPQGQLDRYDEGGLRLMISQHRGVVRIDFGKKVAWIALDPGEAEDLAKVILHHATELRKEQHR
jgi:hypothetical protein